MNLVIIRHGDAGRASTDALRPLTELGRDELSRLGRALARHEFKDAEIWQSGLLRAEQSAQIVAAALGLEPRVSLHPELAPDEPPMAVLEAVTGRKSDLILVGHQPFMGKMVSCLLTGGPGSQYVDFAKGAAACFRPPALAGGNWRLMWLLDPAVLD